MKTVHRHFAVTLASQILATLQGIIIMPLVVRFAGLAVYGASVVWPSALAFVFAASYFGIGYSFRRKIASAGSVGTRRDLFSLQFSYQLTTLICIFAITVLTAQVFGIHFAGSKESAPITVLILWLSVHFLFFQTQEYFRNTLRFDYFNLINIISNLLAVFGIAAWALLRYPITVSVLLMITTITKGIATFPWLIVLVRELGFPKFHLPVHELRNDIKIGWPVALDYISYTVLTFGDRYLITILLSITSVGQYQLGYQLGYLLIFIPRCGEMVLPPLLARTVDSGNRAAAERLTSDFLHLFLMIAAPYLFGSILLGPSIIAILSDPGTAHVTRWITTFVVMGTVMYGVTLLYYQGAYVLGRMRAVLIANIIGASLNIVLNLAFLAIFRNITAAAVACFLSYGASALYVVSATQSQWHLRFDWPRVFRFIFAASLMGGMLMLEGFRPLTVSHVPILGLIGAIAGATAFYFATVWAIGDFKFDMLTRFGTSGNDAEAVDAQPTGKA